MTHKDIFTKFMIEYDKANITSSYPSLTEYEIATFLDKAYLALISQKFTGNNVRKAPFEADVKSIADLQPLVYSRLVFLGESSSTSKANNLWPKTTEASLTQEVQQGESQESSQSQESSSIANTQKVRSMPDNMRSGKLPDDMLYFVAASVPLDMHEIAGWYDDITFDDSNVIKPIDNKDSDYQKREYKRYRMANIDLTSHHIAKNFYATSSNIPWIKNPIAFLENNNIFLLLDPCVGTPELDYLDPDTNTTRHGEWLQLSYIRKPFKFVKDLAKLELDLRVANEDVEAVYTIDHSYGFSFVPDQYFGTDKRKIHLNDICIYPSDATEAIDQIPSTSKKRSTYYVEFNTKLHDPSTLTVDQFVPGNFIFGKRVRCSKNPVDMQTYDQSIYDDSLKLNPDNSIVAVYKDGTNCSQFFVLSYDAVYRLIRSQIVNSNEDKQLAGDTYVTNGNSVTDEQNYIRAEQICTELLPLDADPGEYESSLPDIQQKAVDNITSLSYSSYTLENEAIHSGSLLKDNKGNTLDDYYTFELNDSAAEELISLAISYALENVESPRLNAHIGIRGLES